MTAHELARRLPETPAEAYARKEMAAHLAKALNTLTEREEYVIRRRFLDGATYVQIGRELGFVKGNFAKSLVHKGLAKLRHPSRRALLIEYM